MDNKLASEIRDGIELLVSGDEGVYPYDREITLFMLQAWILFAPNPKMREHATLLAGTRLLQGIERRYQKKHKGRIGSVKLLAALLETNDYRELYDACIADNKGWSRLARVITIGQYDKRVSRAIEAADIAAEMVDYRIRYLDHHNQNTKHANIMHSMVYVHCNHLPVPTKKNLLKAWKAYKESAALVYILKRRETQFRPSVLAKGNFGSKLAEQANDVEALRLFFGECAYVAEVLGELGPKGTLKECFSRCGQTGARQAYE